ncbi:hypothetical protein [Coralloluteibacterium thermophilus]|uniref:EF-hand domain-containing protein n=1 Tax=Coralloluteibacterium thermophilum TaxID=2707049 RepID=A0ABV9NJI4_9GAMM
MKQLLSAGLALAFVSAPALAQQQELPSSMQAAQLQFEEMDVNNDGMLSMREVGTDSALARDFMTYDTDGDGQISEIEFDAYLRAQEQAADDEF